MPGCYKINADAETVGIAWMDGDGTAVPLRVFKKPESL